MDFMVTIAVIQKNYYQKITPKMQKTIEERMKQMFEKTFILNFDRNASIYKEEKKLDEIDIPYNSSNILFTC